MQTGAPIGIILASLVGGFLAPIIGWRECFFISILPALMVIFIRKRLPESDVWLQNKKSIIVNDLKEISAREELNKFLLLFTTYRKSFILSLVLPAYWFTYSWMPDYLYSQRHFS